MQLLKDHNRVAEIVLVGDILNVGKARPIDVVVVVVVVVVIAEVFILLILKIAFKLIAEFLFEIIFLPVTVIVQVDKDINFVFVLKAHKLSLILKILNLSDGEFMGSWPRIRVVSESFCDFVNLIDDCIVIPPFFRNGDVCGLERGEAGKEYIISSAEDCEDGDNPHQAHRDE
ncbi:hypothetical protein HG531_010855 [Fusarium graminearum]|nr:hypothetical protein HG531_010855 [Fusarium graminearum]